MANNVRLLKPEPDLLLLHIELKWIEPAIWRLAVPENITLSKLHTVIQFAMGWENHGAPDPMGGAHP